jgi:peptide/nickel transport system substrate-binding protein
MIARTLMVLTVLSCIVFSSGARTHVAAEEKPKPGGRLTYGTLKDITTTNPFRNTFSTDYEMRSLMFEGLTGLNKDSDVVPCLAESWAISEDGLVYTFTLRRGVKFHNGKGLSSDDVKWSFDYLRDRKNRAYYLEQFNEVKSVEAPNPQTVVLTLKNPFSPLVAVVATARAPILPAGTQISPDSLPPGTGPFQFVEWKAGNHLAVASFKAYWIPRVPYLDEIVFKPITDDNVRVTALKAKDIDAAEELPYQIVAEAKRSKPEFQIVPFEGGVRRRINFNLRIPPFNDVKIRQAIAFAVDKKELADGQTWGFAKPTDQRYPTSSKWFIDLKDRERDLEKAKSLLAEAGHKEGLKFNVPVYPGPDMRLNIVLKEQLRRVGMEMELVTMDWGAHSKVRRSKQYTMYAAGMGLRADPDQIYYADLHSKSTNNNSGYSNPEVDQLLEKARHVQNVSERKRLYTEVLKFVERDVPEIYLYLGPKFVGLLPSVKGFAPGSLEELTSYIGGGLPYTWVER